MGTTPPVGVLLINFGGPETLRDVRPFLYQLFADPEVIRLPALFRLPLAWMISRLRNRQSCGYYEMIGGGSPLRRTTEEQGRALEELLRERGRYVRVYVGMQCWHPFLRETVERIAAEGIERLVVLPLFPQYSVTTTGASLRKLEKAIRRVPGWPVREQKVIRSWPDHPGYVAYLAEAIGAKLQEFPAAPGEPVHLIFSAHSIPKKYVEQGDPYEQETRTTVERVMDRVGRANPYHLTFQSRLGPVEWLEPFTDAWIRKLGADGVRRLLVIPISFVSEHVETLYELDILYVGVAREAGIRDFRRLPAPNLHPPFVQALAQMVERELDPSMSGSRS